LGIGFLNHQLYHIPKAAVAQRISAESENNIEIAKILPHRYPFLLVDKVIHLEKMKRAVGIKSLGEKMMFFYVVTVVFGGRRDI